MLSDCHSAGFSGVAINFPYVGIGKPKKDQVSAMFT
jgi:hypothetical protein